MLRSDWYKGTALAIEAGAPAPPPGNTTLMRVPMTELSGPMIDTVAGNSGAVSGNLERDLESILVGGAKSAASEALLRPIWCLDRPALSISFRIYC